MNRNCWEAVRCGEESRCPAYPNDGRTCFAVPGTYCRRQQQGKFSDKISFCRELCFFYGEIMLESGITVSLRRD